MIFNNKSTPKPIVGQSREVTRFALLPKRINPEAIIWLQRYVEVQRYSYCVIHDFGFRAYMGHEWRIINYKLHQDSK